MVEETAPSVDELEAKQSRLAGDVDVAQAAYEVAKQTFADAAEHDSKAVEALLELSKAVMAAQATVSKAQSAARGNTTAIEGIRYDARMASVTEASLAVRDDVVPVVEGWFDDHKKMVNEFAIDTLVITANKQESGAITVSVKPTGDAMPKRPTTRKGAGNGARGPRGTRNVTTADGTVMSCREYVASCGDDASPAAQADLTGNWDGSPVSYTNEAKRLAAKRGDTFA